MKVYIDMRHCVASGDRDRSIAIESGLMHEKSAFFGQHV